jgi:hypothetical protein
MGLFDIFKKPKSEPEITKSSAKAESDPTPESTPAPVPNATVPNALDDLLKKAATDPAARPAFYKQLLTDDLIVITDKQENFEEGTRMFQENTKINIASFPDGSIPVFTSTERIFEKGIVKEQVPYLKMKGADLLNLVQKAKLLLNPYSDFGKELLPDEISRILDGSIFEGGKEITIQKDTEVLLGQPANYPTAMVQALQNLFRTNPEVNAAYLGYIHDPESGLPPHLLVGIDTEGELSNVSKEAGLTAQQFLKEGEFIDIIKIDQNSGVSDYLLTQTKPFYQR